MKRILLCCLSLGLALSVIFPMTGNVQAEETEASLSSDENGFYFEPYNVEEFVAAPGSEVIGYYKNVAIEKQFLNDDYSLNFEAIKAKYPTFSIEEGLPRKTRSLVCYPVWGKEAVTVVKINGQDYRTSMVMSYLKNVTGYKYIANVSAGVTTIEDLITIGVTAPLGWKWAVAIALFQGMQLWAEQSWITQTVNLLNQGKNIIVNVQKTNYGVFYGVYEWRDTNNIDYYTGIEGAAGHYYSISTQVQVAK